MKFVEADIWEGLREVEVVMESGEEFPGSQDGGEEGVYENWLHLIWINYCWIGSILKINAQAANSNFLKKINWLLN